MNGEGGRFGNAVVAIGAGKWIVAITVMLPTLIEIIDTSVANVALDHIRGSLSSGIDESAWVLTSYLVSNAVIIPMTGWLARTFGRKRYLTFSVLLFTFASLLCGSSTSLGMLVFFRVLQGIGGGALQPMSQAILLETFPPREHGMAMAIFGVGAMFGPIAGPLMGGYITDALSWRWIFYVNIPIGLLAVFMVKMFIQDPPYLLHRRGEKVDTWGIALLTVWVGSLQIVVDKGQREDWFHSDFILVLSAIAVLAFLIFVIVELFVAEHPVVDLRAFRNISFASGNVVMFVAFFNLLGSIVLLPLFAQLLLGYTATLAGLVLSPGGIATLVTMPLVGRYITRHNPKHPLALGVLLCAFSTWTMSNFSLNADFNSLLLPRLYLGFGMGLLFIPLGGWLLPRRAQVHQSRMVEHLTAMDEGLRAAVAKGQALLPSRGVPEAMSEHTTLGRIYGQVVRQATMMGFNDAFYILSWMMACVLPLMFLLRRPTHQTVPTAGHSRNECPTPPEAGPSSP